MKIAKAIEILQIFRDEGEMNLPLNVDPAITLGIEALKWRQHCEAVGYVETCDPLPGETEGVDNEPH